MQQGSYLLIERGMKVHGVDVELGTVAEIVADEGVDVFRGIVISQGVLIPKQSFLSADRIVSVAENGVHVNVQKHEAEHLPPPSAADPALHGKG